MNALRLSLFAVLMLVSGCATSGLRGPSCGPNDQVIRYTAEQQATFTDEQIKLNLARNEELERRGCAVANG
jgi:hypothetical protein